MSLGRSSDVAWCTAMALSELGWHTSHAACVSHKGPQFVCSHCNAMDCNSHLGPTDKHGTQLQLLLGMLQRDLRYVSCTGSAFPFLPLLMPYTSPLVSADRQRQGGEGNRHPQQRPHSNLSVARQQQAGAGGGRAQSARCPLCGALPGAQEVPHCRRRCPRS